MARAFKLYADEREDQEKKLEEASFLTERFQEHAARLIVHRNLIEEQHARSDKQATLTESLAEELKQLKDQSEVRDGQTQDLAAFGKAMKNELATVQRMVDLFIEEVKSGARRISELEEVNQRVESAFARPK
ncbi:hypothetical protein BJY04DRAFT_188521 [Aspergillus karnatakaensis]|uniref:uncharacterized protein n=1 Tax=Aspergillus karnatakaensis TaxID=1810916 RepID=UPI003CCE48AC